MLGQHGVHAGFGNFLHGLRNGGHHGLQRAEHADAVEADHLHVLGNPQAFLFQHLNDFPGQHIGAQKQAVQGKPAFFYMIVQETFKLRKRRAVLQRHDFKWHAHFHAGAYEAVLPFAGLVGQDGADSHKAQLFAAQFFQFVGGHPAAAEIIRRHAGHGNGKKAVDGHKGNIVRDHQIRVVGQGDDAVHPVLAHHLNKFHFPVPVVFREAQEHFVVPLFQGHVDVVHQQGEIGVDGVGDDQGDGVGLIGAQGAPAAVVLIAQAGNGFFYLLPVFLAHRLTVDHLAHRAQGHAGLPGYVRHGGGASFVHRLFTFHGYIS